MSDKPWKVAERKAAKLLGGVRNKRGDDFSRADSDVTHPLFSIECKYRKFLPSLLREGLAQARKYSLTKPPLLVLQERGSPTTLVVLKLSDFVDLFGPLRKDDDHASGQGPDRDDPQPPTAA